MSIVFRAKFDNDGFLAGMYPDDVWPLHVPDITKPLIETVADISWVAPDDNPEAPRPTIDRIVGYDAGPNPNLPDGLVEISEEQYQDLLCHPGQRKWLNGAIVAHEVVPPAPPVLSPAEKLANAGLTVPELKGLLGIA